MSFTLFSCASSRIPSLESMDDLEYNFATKKYNYLTIRRWPMWKRAESNPTFYTWFG